MNLSIEQKALKRGNILNLIMAFVGIILFIFSKSKAVLIDGLFSFIQFISVMIAIKISKDIETSSRKQYPLGQYSKETLYVLFKSILIIILLVSSIFSSIMTISTFISDPSLIPEVNLNLIITNGALMTLLCFALYLIYKHYNKKIENCSEVLKSEAIGANIDAILSLGASVAFILFNVIPFLKPLFPISDAIIVIILTIFFAYQPIQLLRNQISILTYKRIHYKSEQELMSLIEHNYPEIKIYDIFISKLGKFTEIYITLSLSGRFSIDELDEIRHELKKIVNSRITNTQIFITFSNALKKF